jgi:hypothetical protein
MGLFLLEGLLVCVGGCVLLMRVCESGPWSGCPCLPVMDGGVCDFSCASVPKVGVCHNAFPQQ